jgi:hypothetical protein
MKWSDISFTPSSRKLRQFAGLALVVFGGLAIWNGFIRDHRSIAIAFAALAAVIGPVGLIRPQTIRWVYVGWMAAVFPIGWVISQTILAIMFFGVFTAVSLIFRLLGRDALRRRAERDAVSYWQPKPIPSDVRSYLRQS